jgi:hypothetical protein
MHTHMNQLSDVTFGDSPSIEGEERWPGRFSSHPAAEAANDRRRDTILG